MQLQGQLVDLHRQKIYPAQIVVEQGIITDIVPLDEAPMQYILPGFVDAHVHIESSMLVPTEFARLAVVHGTVATVSDPHEIANVLGVAGVEYMLDNADKTVFKCCFGAPSCVPATGFETAGAVIDAQQVASLLQNPKIAYLSEMMNYPGVLHHDPVVWQKIAAAQQLGKPIDGHAPGLRGSAAQAYIAAGISTDHECVTAEEALDKLGLGMKILIREGSAAKNFEALAGLLHEHWDNMMLCSDDKHPDDLIQGHINQLVCRALAKGVELFKVLQAACINPVRHYGMSVGLLRVGDAADFIVVDNLHHFGVLQTYIDGQLVAQNGKSLLPAVQASAVNHFATAYKQPADFALAAPSHATHLRVIGALDGEIVTQDLVLPALVQHDHVQPDIANDVLKIVVVNRYENAKVAVAFVQGFGLKCGAIASTVAHDSHNIIAVGTSDEAICTVVNDLVRVQGGVAAYNGEKSAVLPLPVAGLMTTADGYETAQLYAQLDAMAKQMGSRLRAPYMTLSFMALLVIPSLKLSDKGLFDGTAFAFTTLFTEP